MSCFETFYEFTSYRIQNKDNDIDTLQQQILSLENQLALLTSEKWNSEEDVERVKRETTELLQKVENIETELQNAHEELEKEALDRENLEQEIQERDEMFERSLVLHQEKFSEIMHNNQQSHIAEAVSKMSLEYDEKFEAAIRHLREECGTQLQDNWLEQQELYARREGALRVEVARIQGSLQGKSSELQALETQLTALETKYAAMEAEGERLRGRLADMETGWRADQAGFGAEQFRLQQIIAEMQGEMQEMIGDYQMLLEVKVALINEISTYRILLTGEEER
jgi:chromosome segregation ATPase